MITYVLDQRASGSVKTETNCLCMGNRLTLLTYFLYLTEDPAGTAGNSLKLNNIGLYCQEALDLVFVT